MKAIFGISGIHHFSWDFWDFSFKLWDFWDFSGLANSLGFGIFIFDSWDFRIFQSQKGFM